MSERFARTCKHFTGISSDECKAGIKYVDVRDSSGEGPYKWPCTRADASTTCELKVLPTAEEVERDENDFAELMNVSMLVFALVAEDAKARKLSKGRIYFHRPDGTTAGNAGHGSVFAAYGKENAEILKSCSELPATAGRYVPKL